MPRTQWEPPVLVDDETLIMASHVQDVRDAINSLEDLVEAVTKDLVVASGGDWVRLARSGALPYVGGIFEIALSDSSDIFQRLRVFVSSAAGSAEAILLSSNEAENGITDVRIAYPASDVGLRYLEVRRGGSNNLPLEAPCSLNILGNHGWEPLESAAVIELPEGYVSVSRELSEGAIQAGLVKSDAGIGFAEQSLVDGDGFVAVVGPDGTYMQLKSNEVAFAEQSIKGDSEGVSIVHGEDVVLRVTHSGDFLLGDGEGGQKTVGNPFDFETLKLKAGQTLVTTMNTPDTGDITETLYSGEDVIATKVTLFDTPEAGNVTETVTVGAESLTITTIFDLPNVGDITEVIS